MKPMEYEMTRKDDGTIVVKYFPTYSVQLEQSKLTKSVSDTTTATDKNVIVTFEIKIDAHEIAKKTVELINAGFYANKRGIGWIVKRISPNNAS